MSQKERFIMNISNTLLIKLRMAGIEPTEAALFFGNQANQMLDHKPNYGPSSAKSNNAKHFQLKKEAFH